MSRVRQLGALADADLGVAIQQLNALGDRIATVQGAWSDAERTGAALPDTLRDHIMGLSDELNALNASIDSISHTELPHWLAQSQALSDEIAMLEHQLESITGSTRTHTITVLAIGAVATLVIAGGLAFYVKKKGGSSRAPGLFGPRCATCAR